MILQKTESPKWDRATHKVYSDQHLGVRAADLLVVVLNHSAMWSPYLPIPVRGYRW